MTGNTIHVTIDLEKNPEIPKGGNLLEKLNIHELQESNGSQNIIFFLFQVFNSLLQPNQALQ